jgi:hypothetical protein
VIRERAGLARSGAAPRAAPARDRPAVARTRSNLRTGTPMDASSQHPAPDPTAGPTRKWPPRRVAGLLAGLVLVPLGGGTGSGQMKIRQSAFTAEDRSHFLLSRRLSRDDLRRRVRRNGSSQDICRPQRAWQLPHRPVRADHEQHELANGVVRMGRFGAAQGRVRGPEADLRRRRGAGRGQSSATAWRSWCGANLRLTPAWAASRRNSPRTAAPDHGRPRVGPSITQNSGRPAGLPVRPPKGAAASGPTR